MKGKWDLIKGILFGTLLLVLAFTFWLHSVGNPFHEIALITQPTETTTGHLIDRIEHDSEDDRGHVTVWEVGVYSFVVPNKGEFKTKTESALGELKERQEVEYLSSNPRISRVKGDGCKSIIEFLIRKVIIGIGFLILLLSPGFFVLKNSINDIRNKENRE